MSLGTSWDRPLSQLLEWIRDFDMKEIFYAITTLVVIVLVGGPLIFFLWGSVWSTEPGFGGHFTLAGFESLFQDSVYQMLWNTIVIAIVGTILTLALSVVLLFATLKTTIRGSNFFRFMIISQYMLPSYLLAFGWTFYTDIINKFLVSTPFFETAPLNVYSLWGIILVGAAHYTGLVYLFASGAVRSVPADLEEAAIINGASKLTVFRKITLKLALPSFAIAAVLVFTRFAQSFGFPLILGLPANIFVIATMMYTLLTAFFPPNFDTVAAMGVVLMVLTLFGLYAQRRITGAREKYETIRGGSSTKRLKFDLGRFSTLLSALLVLLIFVIFIAPLGSIVLGSMLSYRDLLSLEFTDMTFTNYQILLVGAKADQFYPTLMNSLIVAGLGAFLGMVLSSFISYIVIKARSDLSALLDTLSLAPIAIPGIVVGTAFMWLFLTYNVAGLYGSLWLIIIALTSKFIVYGTRATNSSFRAISVQLEEAAEMSGANLIGIFRHILVPLIKPGFTAGYIILFVDYIKVLSIPLLLTSDKNVLSTYMWVLIDSQNKELGAAVATVMMLIVGVLYFFAYYMLDVDVSQL